MCRYILLYIYFHLVAEVSCAVELLGNNELESANFHNNWVCSGCRLTLSNDHFSGQHSVLIDQRSRKFSGISQDVNLQPGHRYKLSMYVKVENTPPSAHGQTSVGLNIACSKNSGGTQYITFGKDPYVRTGEWTEISAEHSIPNAIHGCRVYVQIPAASVTYLVDHTSLQLVPDDQNWHQDAQARIELNRKSNITVQLTGNAPGIYDVQVVQTKHDFAFGTAVNARAFLDPQNVAYRNLIYELFEWAVLENALKWPHMEKHQGVIDYNTSLSVINDLRKHGLKIRGHNIFWAVERHVPDWARALNKTELLAAMDMRVNGVVGATKGLVEHWDVNNENLHGDYFETMTGDVNVTMKMFRDTHRVDPDVKLFLNDFGVVEVWAASALEHQARLFKDAGVPIYGVGIQSHLKTVPLDIPSIQNGVQTVARAGLPIWITELTVRTADKQLRANGYEDAMTLYFSIPEVEGILIWGFWDGHIFDHNAALFEGPSVQPNTAGTVLRRLLTSTWRTDVTHHSSHFPDSFSTRGFKGTYNITVKEGDTVLKTKSFHLGDTGKTVTVHLDGPSPNIIVG